ncbi:MAG TPA: hypothetical protein VD884_05425 [Ohtaekwangia sp.]|nr:hypothetical protein [Ohtaekwangia sp.]
MKSFLATQQINRPLFVDFDLYAEGDTEFKKELITHMISNLVELQQELQAAIDQNDLKIFRAACHKYHTTVSMLADPGLDAAIDSIKEGITGPDTEQKIERFNFLCVVIIKSLEKEHLES